MYYVDAGEVAGEEAATAELLSGALLLKTQLAPYRPEFAFMPIQPRAGDLWLFPAYMPHAVLPRKLCEAQNNNEGIAANMGVGLRMSVACNIFKESAPSDGAEAAMRHLMRRMEV